jgi:hypothetical protein
MAWAPSKKVLRQNRWTTSARSIDSGTLTTCYEVSARLKPDPYDAVIGGHANLLRVAIREMADLKNRRKPAAATENFLWKSSRGFEAIDTPGGRNCVQLGIQVGNATP